MWQMNGSYVDSDPAPFNKFGPAPLPAINPSNQSSQTPQPNDYNQIVPIGGRRSQLSNITAVPAFAGDYTENRLRQVEERLNMSEQSCRALLEEVVRLRGELKQSHLRSDEALQGERQARQQLADNIRASNDLIGQLGARLKRAEERVSDERTAVGALVNHTKQVEQAVLGSQQELVARRDQQLAKIAELRNDFDESNRLREQLERATTTLVDEVRAIKGKVDTYQLESTSIVHDVKERTKRLEEDNRTLMDQQRKMHESQHSSEQATALLRTQLDARLGEVRDVLMDLRNRVSTEETERRQQEQNFFLKINDLQSQVHEQSRKRDETLHTIDVVQREREHAADNERLKMQGKIAEIAEEVSRKILSKEIRLREEAQQKFGNIEKYLHAEQAARIAHEQAMREENEKRWAALQKLTEEEVLHVREGQKLDRHKNIGGMSKVNEAMDKLEKMQHETKKQLEAVMKAEIKSRQNQDKQIEDKIEDVQEKLGVAISTLQQAIGGINEQVSSATNQPKGSTDGYQDKVKQMIEEQSQGGLRGLADLDARVVALQTKLASQEEETQQTIRKAIAEAIDDKLFLTDYPMAAKSMLEEQGEKLEKIDDWRDSADKKLKQVKERMDELGPEIREMNRTNESLQEDVKGLIDSESKDRIRDVQMVRQELQSKYTQLTQEIEAAKQAAPAGAEAAVPSIPVTQKEKLAQGKGGGKVDEATRARIDDMEEVINKQRKKIEELKEQIGKVESSIQTVRVHLGRKIDAETKARREDVQDMQGVFEELQGRVAPLLNGKSPSGPQTPGRKDSGAESAKGSRRGNSGQGRASAGSNHDR
ncbi:golgin subfamily A member 6-like protein 22 isoform X2 [Acanthaster planci]|uniref:Golgin subfamily A member 6-like protein 22 isoform X2 n=1 Tax=Acanthaster planci TaxID=133434 RepID=A0A8B7YAE6_ACAPL|nr:golgin subfamily A member 6-like protein 22 isoform X2 [Acanthaster planci]